MALKLILATLVTTAGFSSLANGAINVRRPPHKFSYRTLTPRDATQSDGAVTYDALHHLKGPSASAGQCIHPPPPRGWDSFDNFPIPVVFNEQTLLQEAQLLSQNFGVNTSGGYNYLIIDEGWAEFGIGQWMLDRWGRPIPNTFLYPSSAETGGFAPLANTLSQSFGLDLGLWIIKGIPQMAVDMNAPIKGTSYTAADIALEGQGCPWHKDVLAINMSHPGGQAYYDSLAELYVGEWGVKYIKIDCVFGTDDIDTAEVNGFSMAMNAVDPSAIVSLSPGQSWNDTLIDTAIASNLYRITGDLHDCWSTNQTPCSGHPIVDSTQTLINVQPFLDGAKVVPNAPFASASASENQKDGGYQFGSFPDPDMLPLGDISVGHDGSKSFSSYVTSIGMSRYIYGMWSITRSPLVLGGGLKSLVETDFLNALLSNPYLTALHQCSANPTVLFQQGQDPSGDHGIVIWGLQHGAIANALYVGYFAYSNDPSASYSESLILPMDTVIASLPLKYDNIQYFQVIDVASGTQIGGNVDYTTDGTFPAIAVPANDAAIVAIIAFS